MPFAGPPWTAHLTSAFPSGSWNTLGNFWCYFSEALRSWTRRTLDVGNSSRHSIQEFSIQVHTRHTKVRENYRILYRFFIDSRLWETFETLRESLLRVKTFALYSRLSTCSWNLEISMSWERLSQRRERWQTVTELGPWGDLQVAGSPWLIMSDMLRPRLSRVAAKNSV